MCIRDRESAQSVELVAQQEFGLRPVAEFLGVPYWDDDIYKMVVRFLFNLVFLALVVGVAYNANNDKNKRYLFSFLIMNVVVFFICFTLKKLQLELGMALGLFAIFAIIRFRTDQIDMKDMTYLFVVIGLAVINSLSNKKTSYVELLFTNVVVFAACLLYTSPSPRDRQKSRMPSSA